MFHAVETTVEFDIANSEGNQKIVQEFVKPKDFLGPFALHAKKPVVGLFRLSPTSVHI